MQRRDRALGCAILFILALYGHDKLQTGRFGELLWGCHAAGALIAVGLLAGARLPVGAGFVFYMGLGVPAWFVDASSAGTTTALSIVTHVFPPVAAALSLSRTGVPRGSAIAGWGMFLVLLWLSRALTDPALNVNLAHHPFARLDWIAPSPAAAVLLLCLGPLATLHVAERLFRRLLRPRNCPV